MNNDKCKCGKESTVAAHGIKNKAVYSEYWCDDCYNNKKSLPFVPIVPKDIIKNYENKDS
jgi:hypothetical protein